MWRCWMWPLILAWVSMATQTLCQSGDVDWGSGSDIDPAVMSTNDTSQAAGDEPVRMKNNRDSHTSAAFPSPSPTLHHEPQPDRCSLHFATDAALARRLKAERGELAYLQAIQHGNEAVMENLAQFVGAEVGDQRYEDVIEENLVGTQEEHKRCQEVVEKAEEDLEKQLEGDALDSLAGMQKIREESSAFDNMLRAAADIANRLESSSQALQASFTKQLKDIIKIHR
ncbi:uncharacterized protein si:ch211-142k18.1 [Hippoglossus hippoglossus]|uniref:uncharacterized protein si:ch211-142k18.1 n=1 Tax=Hippoglossus hippoglossus TaxID=8267 RepID=UPI00148D1B07|nr:uncharacterized protein si:ch211-142k18.1 [Hippoglossus hippoglossus]XP_034435808.1 uncharacterized protein si:ch211-142k18.1 [Hippoglossus hippoglossus]XP_034435809.1 uncharacterized protein si:ch211-142k18.1 [Hippoglossus hippoglossus]